MNRAFLPSMRARQSGLIVYVSSSVGPHRHSVRRHLHGLEVGARSAGGSVVVRTRAVRHRYGDRRTRCVQNRDLLQNRRLPTISHASPRTVRSRAEPTRAAAAVEASAVGRDPNDVATAIVRLANAPAGTRPLRTTVPPHPRRRCNQRRGRAAASEAGRKFAPEGLSYERLIIPRPAARSAASCRSCATARPRSADSRPARRRSRTADSARAARAG